jgi:hypothetical protein
LLPSYEFNIVELMHHRVFMSARMMVAVLIGLDGVGLFLAAIATKIVLMTSRRADASVSLPP